MIERTLLLTGALIFLALPVAHSTQNSSNSKRAVAFADLPEQVCSISTDRFGQFPQGEGDGYTELNDPKKLNSSTLKKTVQSYGESTKTASICSATVSSSRQLITSAHCLTRIGRGKRFIKCPGNPPILLKDSGIKLHEKYKQDRMTNDLAVLSVDNSLGIKPVRIVQSAHEFEQLKKINQCFTAGYGQSNENRNLHTLAGTRKDLTKIRVVKNEKWREFISMTGVKSMLNRNSSRKQNAHTLNEFFKTESPSGENLIMVEPEGAHMNTGDSGGGLYCRDQSGNLYLIGVNAGTAPWWDPVLERYEDLITQKSWLQENLNSEAPDLSSLMRTKKAQIVHFCKRSEECMNIMSANGFKSTADMIQILDVISEDTKKVAKQKNSTELSKILNSLKSSYVKLVEKCYDRLRTLLQGS